MKILICDKIHPKALILLEQDKISFDYLPEITADELLQKVTNYEGLVVRSRTKVTKEVIEKGVHLKIIGRVGSGLDNIDASAAQRQKITVVNAPGANAQSVAEHTIALMLNLLHPIQKANVSMHAGKWLKKELKGMELSGKKVGIVGYGHIGKIVEKILTVFGCQVSIFSRSYKTTSLETIFDESDIVTIHIALTPDTKGLISKELLARMKPNSFFVNCSRGEVVDEHALLELIQAGKIAGTALDVFETEPLSNDSKWRSLENVILTPHIAASSVEAFERASIEVANKIIEFTGTK